MGKYTSLESDIYDILASPAWKTEGIKSYPVGFEGEKGSPPYVRVTIVPSGPPLNASSSSGVLQVEIFTAWGAGPTACSEIADKLDNHFAWRSKGGTQLFASSLGNFTKDRDDKSLGSSLYSLPFSFFGANK